MTNNEQGNMPSVLDREVSDRSQDAFGHQHFADALRSLIEDGSNHPPFSIGLLGPWGTGKSTIKELYLAGLQGDQTGERGKRRKDRLFPITFNAWRYGGEDIKRALLRHAFLALGGDETTLRRELYQQVNQSSQTRRSLWEWSKEAIFQNLASVTVFLLLLAGCLALMFGFAWLVGLEDQLSLTVLGSTTIVLAGFLARNVVDIRLKSPAFFNPTTSISFPSTSVEEYEQLLVGQIREFKESKEGCSFNRLVVFVDDLDRLSASEMVVGLDAVRTFLELPASDMPNGLGVVFVISCDEERVAEALARARGSQRSDLPGTIYTQSDARRYLDRLFQFRLEIPLFPKLDMREFAKNKLLQMESIVQDLESHGVRTQDLLDRLIHVGVQTPRNALQILNAFAQSWWIATKRERGGIGSNAPGALHEGAVTSHPIALAALCVLRVDFPDFFSQVQKRPELIREFNSIVFGTENAQSLAIGARQALMEFLIQPDGSITSDVRTEYRGLRQYLSSLQGLRWPDRLQPLLLLAEDSITRRYGDRAAELHEAFVSGDTQGVLEVFGRRLDAKNLMSEDIRLLEDLAEEVNHDTDVRKISAARVLAGIANRVPEEHARGLMTPLARQLIDLKEVRINVGPIAAKEIIQYTAKVDQQDVAARFCDDLLIDKKIEWRLPTGETPSLEEMVRTVKDTVELVLEVRRVHGLSERTDQQLRSWLLSREVRLEKQSRSLPFGELEKWLSEHAENLLEDLSSGYTNLAIAEFEADYAASSDPKETIIRIGKVFSLLAKEGEESRELLWEQLTRLIAVRSSDAVTTGWNTAAMFSDSASNIQANNFINAMSGRLQKDMEDGEEWELEEWRAGAETFLNLLTQWSSKIEDTTAESMSQLLIAWSGDQECAAYAARGCEILQQINSDAMSSIMDYLVAQPVSEIPLSSHEISAKEFEQLSDAQKTTLITQFDQVINADNVDEEVANNYIQLVRAIPVTEWESASLQQHAERLLKRLEAMFQNKHGYLSKLFPAGKELLKIVPKERVGGFIKKIFEQAAGSPVAYPIIHREMIGAWPVNPENIAIYEPTAIATRAVQFIQQHPSADGVGYVFESIVDMVNSGIVPESFGSNVASAAVLVWPHSNASIIKNISVISGFLSPSDMKEILTGTQPGDDYVGDLKEIMDSVIKRNDDAKNIATAQEILSVQPTPLDDIPDGALFMWLGALQAEKASIVDKLLQVENLNEVQKERVYRYAIESKEELGLPFFITALPRALDSVEEQGVLKVAIDTSSEIASMANTKDDKSELCGKIIPTLLKLSGENLVVITRLIRDLGGKGALERSSQIIDQLDKESLDILVQELPDSKKLKKALASRSE